MRSLFAKLFFCMLLVPVLARGGGLLLSATLSDNRPEVERAMDAALPLYAQAIGAVMDRDGPAAAQAVVAATQKGGRQQLSLYLSAPAEGGCASLAVPAAGEGRPSLAMAVPLVSRPAPACLVATLLPRPRLFGVLPGPWWTLMPLVEPVTCAVVSFFLARYLARPIRHLRSAAAAFAGGDLAGGDADPAAGSGLLRQAARQSSGWAMFAVRLAYVKGLGVAGDPARAVPWLEAAANHISSDAMMDPGCLI